MIGVIITVFTLIANWRIFTKMGRKGWESLIPLYNSYVMFDVIYGNGWRFLLLLIPIVNIIVGCKMYIDLAHNFGKSTAFGIGLILLNTIFILILGFDSSVYLDGSMDMSDSDEVAQAINDVRETFGDVKERFSKDPNALEKLRKLEDLRIDGAITEEEFQEKKAELMKKI